MASCTEEFLTKDHPTATTDDNWWETEAQLLSAMQYVYDLIPHGTYQYQPNSKVSFTGMTDDAVWTANYFGEINRFALGNGSDFTPDSEISAVRPLWETNYGRIRMANRILANADKVYTDAAIIQQYKMEVRVLRAWYHLDLFLLYGDIPIVDKVITPTEANLKRNTTDEVIDFITSELDAAVPYLPLEHPTGSEHRITKGIALTMKALAFLNVHRYSEAAEAARQVIDLNHYELYPSYFDLFLYAGQNNREWIWKRGGNGGFYLRLAPPNAAGTSNVNPTAAIINDYETKQGKTIWELGIDSVAIYKQYPNYNDNRDPRLSASVVYPGVVFYSLVDPFDDAPTNLCRIGAINSSRTGYWVRKYTDLRDRANPSRGTLPYMIFRYADVLLMYVEALVESGQWNHPDVVKYLNLIRNRAGMPDVDISVYNSEAKLRELYRRERRIELAFEGQRLLDIRRWKIAGQVMTGTVEGATNPATGETVQVEARHFNPDRDYLWPIPAREIQGNPNMEQNPGY